MVVRGAWWWLRVWAGPRLLGIRGRATRAGARGSEGERRAPAAGAMCLDNKRPMPQSAQAPGDWEGALGGTRAKAIRSLRLEAPPMKEVLGAIPPECFVKDTRTSLAYCAFSTALTLATLEIAPTGPTV